MTFTTEQVITAGLGRLCCSVEELYHVMNFLTGDNLFTHQLPRAFHACRDWVLVQQPWLNDLDAEQCTTETWRRWLQAAISKYGESFELKPLPPGQWESRNPIEEAVELMGGDENKVVVAKIAQLELYCPPNR